MPAGTRVRLGIGDDAAVWRPSRSSLSVITTDALVEDVHFTRDGFTFFQIGHRALASNLSDIAAMGARPVLATIALGVPPDVGIEPLMELYEGIQSLAKRTKTAIAGGDIVRSEKLALSITIVGEVRPSNLKRRSGARARDVLAVTGELGASRAGLDGSGNPEAIAKHRTPEPRLREGRWLAASTSVHAMMDLSDGVAMDLPRMAAASGLGAIVEVLPISPSAREMAQARNEEARDYALAAGEDFELLVAVAPRAFAHLADRFQKRFGYALTAIGTMAEGGGVSMRSGEGTASLPATGWDHLARS
ncbi:MAG: thiamine-phosphate kinase [Candidatus Eremiobacteraeota bacterium]|nr:thiamine-phosphate kinase [Candidatus Eremiobacteraeota bacterium]